MFNVAIVHAGIRPTPSKLQDAFRNPNLVHRGSTFTDRDMQGAMWNHRRAIRWASMMNEPTLIVEDDAIPSRECAAQVHNTLNKLQAVDWSHVGIISMYLGKGAPVNRQPVMQQLIDQADLQGRDYIESDELWNAVAYVINPKLVKSIADRLSDMKLEKYTEVDRTLGLLLPSDMQVRYTLPCLFDHNIDLKSTVKHTGNRPNSPRVAWRFQK